MHLVRITAKVFATVAASIICASAFATDTVVGTLPGDFSVDNKGAANYSIPLSVPPGVNGMEPGLALVYNSNGGEGIAGVGWSLSTGFPQSIVRGRTILARDDVVRGVTFSANDRFYLDGKLLVCVSGQYGQPGSVYRTEVDSFCTITTAGTGTSSSTWNVDTFTMTTKDGKVMTFGKLGNAADAYQPDAMGSALSVNISYRAMASTYALKQVIDPSGNIITYSYSLVAAGNYVLSRIDYGAVTSGSGHLAVKFIYGAKTDARLRYSMGGYTRDNVILNRVVAEVGGSLIANGTEVNRFDLTYDVGIKTKRSRLTSISETVSSLTTAYPATTNETSFQYTSDAGIIPVQSTTLDYLTWTGNNPNPYDFCVDPSAYTVNGDSDRDGSDEIEVVNGLVLSPIHHGHKVMIKTGDFDGDGIPDRMVVDLSFLAPPIQTVAAGGQISATITLSGGGTRNLGDLRGYFYDTKTDGTIFTGSQFCFYKEETGVLGRIVIGDFTGDGRDDILIHSMQGRLFLLKSGNQGFDAPVEVASGVGGAGMVVDNCATTESWDITPCYSILRDAFLYPTVADFDGDGVMDYAFINMEADGLFDHVIEFKTNTVNIDGYLRGGTINVLLSNGDGTFSQPTLVNSFTTTDPSVINLNELCQGYRTGDFNGDGKTDIIYSNNMTATGDHFARWWILFSMGRDSDGKAIFDSIPGSLPNIVSIPGGTSNVRTYYKPCSNSEWVSYSNPALVFQLPNASLILGTVESSLGFMNTFFIDMNDDGLTDFLWYVDRYSNDQLITNSSLIGWYVMYSTGIFTNAIAGSPATWGAGFTAPVRLGELTNAINGCFTDYPCGPRGIITNQPYTNTGFAALDQIEISKGEDFNGDGYGDFLIKRVISGYTRVADGTYGARYMTKVLYSTQDANPLHPVANPDLLCAISDGLQRRTEIKYKAAKDGSIYTKGATVSYPIREILGSNPVVSDLYKDFGGNFWTDTNGDHVRDEGEPYQDAYHFSYQYSGNRTDLSGRGPLGFHCFVTLDWQTLLFKYQFLAQSFPMTGLTKREQTYRATPSYSGTTVTGFALQPISAKDNDVVFDSVCLESGGDIGTVYSFMSHSKELRWEDNIAEQIDAEVSNPESLFASYNTQYPSNVSRAHSAIESYVWFDQQDMTTLPATQLPAPYISSGSIPGSEDSSPMGFSDWKLYGNQLISNGTLPRQITYGNIRLTRLNYSDGYKTDTRTEYYIPLNANGNRSDLVQWTQVRAKTPTAANDRVGPVTSYLYDARGLVTTKTIDTSCSGGLSLNWDNNPTSKWAVYPCNSQLGSTETYSYTNRGLLVSKTFTDDPTATGYYVIGDNIMLSEVTAWDPTGRFPRTVVDNYGHATNTEYDIFGRVTHVTDFNGQDTTTQYDALGRVISVTDNLRGLSTNTVIDSTPGESGISAQTVARPVSCSAFNTAYTTTGGLLLESSYYSCVTTDGAPPVTTYYDRTGRQIRVIKGGYVTQSNVPQSTLTDTIYDLEGKVIAVSNPYPSGASGSDIPWTVNKYDALGRIWRVTAPTGTVTTTTYNGRVTTVSVDATDRDAQATTTLVNVRGETVKVWNPDRSPTGITQTGSGTSVTASVEFVPDGLGKVVETKLAGQAAFVTSSFDPLGSQVALNDPDKGSWSYIYDALGRLRWQRDANLNVTTITYDNLGRQLTRTIAEASSGPVETTDWYYYETNSSCPHAVLDTATQWIGAVQREVTTTTQIADPKVERSYYYDRLGRVFLDLHHIDGKWYYRHQIFDRYGKPERVDYYWRPASLEGSATVKPYLWQSYGYINTYDAQGYVTQVTDTTGKVWWQADGAAYDYMDRPVRFYKGGTSATGRLTLRTYDAISGLLTGITTGGGAVQAQSYTYDGLGNLHVRTDTGGGRNLTETFAYDNLNRLTSAVVGTTTLSYSYEANGNILTKDDVSDVASGTYAYGSTHPHAVTGAFNCTIGYDANGNVTSRSGNNETWSFKWSGFDKPRWMGRYSTSGTANTRGSAFIYGPDHERVVHYEFDSFSGGGAVGTPYHYTDKKIYVSGGGMEVEYKSDVAGGTPTWNLKKVRIYIPAPGGNAGSAELDPNGTSADAHKRLVYHYDHLGSIQAVTEITTDGVLDTNPSTLFANDAQSRESAYSYDPWGQRRDVKDWKSYPWGQSTTAPVFTWGWDDPTTTGANQNEDDLIPRGFTGHEMMDDLGLIHMNGRIYDPRLSRFLSADIAIQLPANLQSYNRYSYCMNNPLGYTDPSGYLLFGLLPDDPNLSTMGNIIKYAGSAVEGVNGGSHIAINALTCGLSDKVGLTQSGNFTGSVYQEANAIAPVVSGASMIASGGSTGLGGSAVLATQATGALISSTEQTAAGVAELSVDAKSVQGWADTAKGVAGTLATLGAGGIGRSNAEGAIEKFKVDPKLSEGVIGSSKAERAVASENNVVNSVRTETSLTTEQAKNVTRFEKNLPGTPSPTALHPLPNGGVAAQANVPGRVPGSYATYEKQIDSTGKTIQFTKTTVDPAGNIVHVKDKMTGEQIP
jgi:RHS repeat-associated protein